MGGFGRKRDDWTGRNPPSKGAPRHRPQPLARRPQTPQNSSKHPSQKNTFRYAMSCSTPRARKWCTSSTARLLLKNAMSKDSRRENVSASSSSVRVAVMPAMMEPTLLPASTRGSMRCSNSALTTPCVWRGGGGLGCGVPLVSVWSFGCCWFYWGQVVGCWFMLLVLLGCRVS